MRKLRAILTVTAVAGSIGALLGAAQALLSLKLSSHPPLRGLSPAQFVWMMTRGWAVTMAIVGAVFALTLGLGSRLSAADNPIKPWIAWGAVGISAVCGGAIFPRLAGLHVPLSMIAGPLAALASVATIAALVVVAFSMLASRRSTDTHERVDRNGRGPRA
jgi:hypothetical protein